MKHQSLCAMIVAFGTFAAFSLISRPAQAWGEIGHKVVARIAWDNLTPEARTKLIALLETAPADSDIATLHPAGLQKEEANRIWFETAATWPDIVRAQKTDAEKTRRTKYHHGPWHYYDIFFEQNPVSGAIKIRTDKQNDKENAVERLGFLSSRLADVTVEPEERAIALAWIEHLVGDVHTPLHNVTRITPTEPGGDQGGNLFKLEEKPAPGKPYAQNLHSFWDDLPDTAFPASTGEDKETRIARIAGVATGILPKTLFEREGLNQAGQFAQWNREGAEVAISKVYPLTLKRNELPNATYTEEAKQTVLVALAKAGYRLATTLETALADKK